VDIINIVIIFFNFIIMISKNLININIFDYNEIFDSNKTFDYYYIITIIKSSLLLLLLLRLLLNHYYSIW